MNMKLRYEFSFLLTLLGTCNYDPSSKFVDVLLYLVDDDCCWLRPYYYFHIVQMNLVSCLACSVYSGRLWNWSPLTSPAKRPDDRRLMVSNRIIVYAFELLTWLYTVQLWYKKTWKIVRYLTDLFYTFLSDNGYSNIRHHCCTLGSGKWFVYHNPHEIITPK